MNVDVPTETGQPAPAVRLEADATAEADRWNQFVDRSPQGTALHRTEALAVVADHAGAELHRLKGFVDGRLVGVMPIFERSVGPLTAAFSAPPGLGLPPLSPCLEGGDRTAGERAITDDGFLRACWEHVARTIDPDYVRLTVDGTVPVNALTVRDGIALEPRFTYVLDLSADRDELFSGFSSDARRNVRNTDPDRYEIYEGGRSAIRRIVERMQRRYREQDMHYPVSVEFVSDLYDEMPTGAVRPYAVAVDGEFSNGLVVLDDGETVSRWQGGGKTDVDVPVNDLLDWQVIREAVERGRREYDFVGANTPSICDYKAKFNPDLVGGCVVERSSAGMGLIRDVYRRLQGRGLWPLS